VTQAMGIKVGDLTGPMRRTRDSQSRVRPNRKSPMTSNLPGARKLASPCGFGVSSGFTVLGSPAKGGKIEESATGRSKETACEVSPAMAEEGEGPARQVEADQ